MGPTPLVAAPHPRAGAFLIPRRGRRSAGDGFWRRGCGGRVGIQGLTPLAIDCRPVGAFWRRRLGASYPGANRTRRGGPGNLVSLVSHRGSETHPQGFAEGDRAIACFLEPGDRERWNVGERLACAYNFGFLQRLDRQRVRGPESSAKSAGGFGFWRAQLPRCTGPRGNRIVTSSTNEGMGDEG